MRRQVIDAGISVVVLAFGLVEILGDPGFAPRGVWLAAVVVTAGSLLLRRRWPLPVMIVVLTLMGLTSSLDSPTDPTYWFLAALVAVYAVGAYPRLPVALAGLAFGFLDFAVGAAIDGQSVSDVAFVWALLTGVWLAGLLIERRTTEAASLARQTRILEEEREHHAREAIAEERARIARELHDIVAHGVSTMVLQVGGVRRRLTDGQDAERDVLMNVEETGRRSLVEMHRMLGIMRTADEGSLLTPQPGLERLGDLAESMRVAGLPVELHVEGEPVELPSGLDLSAYRIVQEALTNTLKHAGRARASVTVAYRPDGIDLEIVDDGQGSANGNGAVGGHGLVGMRERVALFDGRLDAGSRSDGGGYRVHAHLPL
jgi:signal transduction histidine kinase